MTASPGITWPKVEPGTSIPRILHQNMLKGWDALAPEMRESIEAMKARNPGWEYRFRDGAAAEAFIRDVWGPGMLRIWESIDPVYYAARSDLLRYLITYVEGGVYLDIKSTAMSPLDEVIRPDDVYILSQWAQKPNRSSDAWGEKFVAVPGVEHVPGGEYVQWFIITAPGHPFLKAVIEEVVRRIAAYDPFADEVGKNGVFRVTGPTVYTVAIEPLRATTPHRYACFDSDLDFIFSIYGKRQGHKGRIETHYSKQTRPVIRRNAMMSAAVGWWFRKMDPRIRRWKARRQARG